MVKMGAREFVYPNFGYSQDGCGTVIPCIGVNGDNKVYNFTIFCKSLIT